MNRVITRGIRIRTNSKRSVCQQMKVVVILAMHGVPPKDYPKAEMSELFALHGQVHSVRGPEREALQRRHDALEDRMRAWPRTPQNDPFHAGSLALAARLSEILGAE